MKYKEASDLLSSKKIEEDKLISVFSFLEEKVIEHEVSLEEAELSIELVMAAERNSSLTPLSKTNLLLLVVNLFTYTYYPWRVRTYAKEIMKICPLLDDFDYLFEVYETLHDYFKSLSDYKTALFCAIEMEKYATSKSDKGIAFYNQVVLHNELGDGYIVPYDQAQIQAHFGESTARIQKAMNKKGYIKRDPIEFTEAFQAIYDEVNEEVEHLLEEEGRLHIAFQRWSILADVLEKRHIHWRNPHIMNPDILFD